MKRLVTFLGIWIALADQTLWAQQPIDAPADESAAVQIDEDDRSMLGDIWNSATTAGNAGISGVDVTQQVLIEEILEPSGDYRYASFGKPDPFLPPYELLASLAQTGATVGVGREVPTNADGEEIAIVSPLQTDLENLTVIGMWQLDDGTRKALISNNTSQAVIAEVGDPIGYTGRIIEIKPEGVITRQYKLRVDGSREYEDVLLLFGDSEEILKRQIGTRVVLTPGGGTKIETVGPRINASVPAGPVPIEDIAAGTDPTGLEKPAIDVSGSDGAAAVPSAMNDEVPAEVQEKPPVPEPPTDPTDQSDPIADPQDRQQPLIQQPAQSLIQKPQQVGSDVTQPPTGM